MNETALLPTDLLTCFLCGTFVERASFVNHVDECCRHIELVSLREAGITAVSAVEDLFSTPVSPRGRAHPQGRMAPAPPVRGSPARASGSPTAKASRPPSVIVLRDGGSMSPPKQQQPLQRKSNLLAATALPSSSALLVPAAAEAAIDTDVAAAPRPKLQVLDASAGVAVPPEHGVRAGGNATPLPATSGPPVQSAKSVVHTSQVQPPTPHQQQLILGPGTTVARMPAPVGPALTAAPLQPVDAAPVNDDAQAAQVASAAAAPAAASAAASAAPAPPAAIAGPATGLTLSSHKGTAPGPVRAPWTDAEVMALRDGIRRLGIGQWARILREGSKLFHPKRTAVDLKDKYRNLKRSGQL